MGWDIDGVSPLVYHSPVNDLRDELASLVADAQAALDALRLQGVMVLPRAAAGAHPGVPDVAAEVSPAPRPAAPVPAPRASAPVMPAAPVVPRAAAPNPPAEAAPTEPTRSFFGAWAALAEGPAERLQKVQATFAETCPECGEAPLVGVGATRSGVVLVVDDLSVAQEAVLTNMLVRVVSVEPADVWTVRPRACPRCRAGLVAQVQALRPRVVLGLGAGAARCLDLPERGVWGLFAGAEAVATWHPAEMDADAARKRPAFEVLQAVARRR